MPPSPPHPTLPQTLTNIPSLAGSTLHPNPTQPTNQPTKMGGFVPLQCSIQSANTLYGCSLEANRNVGKSGFVPLQCLLQGGFVPLQCSLQDKE